MAHAGRSSCVAMADADFAPVVPKDGDADAADKEEESTAATNEASRRAKRGFHSALNFTDSVRTLERCQLRRGT